MYARITSGRKHGSIERAIQHSDAPAPSSDPIETVMIYPNAAKDVETTAYPYAELFRDFAAALCRPNSALILYGYGFGDDHVNRVLADMLSLPSTHLVVFAYALDERVRGFMTEVSRPAQVSLLVGPHFADLRQIVEHYLPKPAIDQITGRMAELLKARQPLRPEPEGHMNDASKLDAEIAALIGDERKIP